MEGQNGEKNKCPICNSEVVELIHKGVRDNEWIDVYECQECHVKFLSTFNDNDYESGFMHKSSNTYEMSVEEHLKEAYEDDYRRFLMVKEYCSGKNVLDFGCGFRGFLKEIKTVAKSVVGVELGQQERNYINSLGIECVKNIDELLEAKKKYDVITLFHVFEHLDNPRFYLKKFAEHLVDGGKLIIEVPNANDALLSLYDCRAFADFTYWSAHLILYNEMALFKLVTECDDFEAFDLGFFQRYPIANHLMWLAKGMPAGHKKWEMFNNKNLIDSYEKILKENKMSDTLFHVYSKK